MGRVNVSMDNSTNFSINYQLLVVKFSQYSKYLKTYTDRKLKSICFKIRYVFLQAISQ
jgi:hypothetical protein